jgi:NAD(P)-dependent dehydrogenase (short-subunit alcohol dehydrogenase family)
MLARGGGSIINVSSGSGIAGSPSAAAYGAAKAGIIVLTKYVATQYGKRGIRCNTIVPGWTVGGTSWAKPEEERTDADRQFLDNALADVCLPRLADADDVAPVVAFLASDGARYVQGATLEVNGGLLAHMPGLAGAPAAHY